MEIAGRWKYAHDIYCFRLIFIDISMRLENGRNVMQDVGMAFEIEALHVAWKNQEE